MTRCAHSGPGARRTAQQNIPRPGECLACLRAERDALRSGLLDFAAAAEAYMRYHAEKFYGGLGSTAPTGLWPAILAARDKIAYFRDRGA